MTGAPQEPGPDGHSISGQFVPYPGLRSFQRDETSVFFGRDGAIHHLLGRLAESRFLAVLGASGSGKSSLVRTGMLEGLEMGLISGAGTLWRIVDIPHPGADPMLALARALSAPGAGADEVEQMRAFLLGGPRSLVEWAGAGRLASGENLLLLVDQFEEIFRYRSYSGHQETEAFIALILESARSRDVPIYVTLTMRSEYLGACALFVGLAEAMNRGQYLTPRLGREECRAAIEGPAAVCGFSLEPELVTTLLNDLASFAPWSDGEEGDLRSQLDMIGRRADQLPLLQHVLNRLWLKASARETRVAPVLTRADYLVLGGLRGAIDQHAEEIASGLSEAGHKAMPAVFQALTTGASVADAVRRPTRLSTIAEVCGTDADLATEIVEAFRQPGCNFLMPPTTTRLRSDTDVDISHESLIRQWTSLSGWLEAEAQDAESMRRLDEAATREATGTGELLEGRALAALAGWQKESPHPEAWAARYVRDARRAFDFLGRSIEAATRRRRIRTIWRAAIGTGLTVMAILSVVFVVQRNENLALTAETQRLLGVRDALETDKAELAANIDNLKTALTKNRDNIFGIAGNSLNQNFLTGQIDTVADMLSLVALIDDAAAAPALAQQVAVVLRLNGGGRPSTEASDLIDAAVSSGAYLSDPSQNLSPRSIYTLKAVMPDEFGPRYAVIDLRNERVVHTFSIPEDIASSVYEFAISPSGTIAILGSIDGRLLRWEAGMPSAWRIIEPNWRSTSDLDWDEMRSYSRAVFDERSGDIGISFSVYGPAHFLRLGRADEPTARPWRQDELLARLAATSPPLAGYDWSLELVGLRDGAFVLAVSSFELTRIVMIDMADGGTVRQIGPDLPWAFPLLIETSDPDRLTVSFDAPVGGCGDPSTREENSETPQILGYCLASLNLATGMIDYDPVAHPTLTNSTGDFFTMGMLSPLDPGGTAVIGGLGSGLPESGFPALALVGHPDDPAFGHLPWIDSWRYAASNDAANPLWSDFFEIRQRADGLTLWSKSPYEQSGFTVEDALVARDRAAVHGEVLSIYIWGEADLSVLGGLDQDASLILSHDASSGVLSDGKSPMDLVRRDDPDGTLERIQLRLHDSCRADGVAKPQSDDGAKASSDSDPGQEAKGSVRLIQLVREGHDWFLAEWTTRTGRGDEKRHILVRLRTPEVSAKPDDGRAPEAELYCPPASNLPAMLGSDLVTGSIAWASASGRKVTIWRVPDDEGSFTSFEVDLPPGKSVVSAAFLADGTVILADSVGALHAVLLSVTKAQVDATQEQTQAVLKPLGGLVLPGLARMQANGNQLLLMAPSRTAAGRDGYETELVTLLLAKVNLKSGSVLPTHGAALPVAASNIVALRPDADLPVVQALLWNGSLLRLGLPVLPAGEVLSGYLQSLASPAVVTTDTGNNDFSIIRLLQSSLAGPLDPAPLSLATGCGALVERVIADLVEGAIAPVDPSNCTDPSALALAAKIESLIRTPATGLFDETVVAMLDHAAAGETLALRAVLEHLSKGSKDETGLVAHGANALLARLSAGDPAFQTLDLTGSADALAHDHLTRSALSKGDVKTAFRHAWIAESTFMAAGQAASAAELRNLRYAAGSLLSPDDRLAILQDLAAWSPDFAPQPTARDAGIEADLAALDRIATLTGATPEIALLKLGRLEDARISAEGPADELTTRAAELVISTRSWPEGTADLNGMAATIDSLRDSLPPERLDLITGLDAALISSIEEEVLGPDGYIDETDRARHARLLETYTAAAGRLLVISKADRGAATSVLRFQTEAFAIPPDLGGLSLSDKDLDLLSIRQDLALSFSGAEGAAVAAPASALWRAMLLRAAGSGDTASDDLAKAAFNDLMLLGRDGNLGTLAEKGVLAIAASYVSDDLFSLGIRPETADWDLLSATLDDLANQAQHQGAAHFLAPPMGLRVQILFDVLYDLQETLPPAVDPRNPSAALAEALAMIETSARPSGLWHLGALSQFEQDDYFSDWDWPNAPTYAIAWAAAPGTVSPAGTDDCSLLASFPKDPTRLDAGVTFDTLKQNADAAIAACRSELAMARAEGNKKRVAAASFHLGRALTAQAEAAEQTNIPAPALTCLLAAAEAGHAAALNNLSFHLDDANVPYARVFYQLVLRDHFPAAYAVLQPHADTGAERDALAFFARDSADLGSGEANAILARIETDPVEREYRRQIAERLLQETGAGAFSAESLSHLSDARNDLSTQDYSLHDYIAARVSAWAPLQPQDISEELKNAYPDQANRTCQ